MGEKRKGSFLWGKIGGGGGEDQEGKVSKDSFELGSIVRKCSMQKRQVDFAWGRSSKIGKRATGLWCRKNRTQEGGIKKS